MKRFIVLVALVACSKKAEKAPDPTPAPEAERIVTGILDGCGVDRGSLHGP